MLQRDPGAHAAWVTPPWGKWVEAFGLVGGRGQRAEEQGTWAETQRGGLWTA